MTEPKPRRMSEKTRERLACSLAAKQQLLDLMASSISEYGPTNDIEWLISEADQAADTARTIARVARRLAKAGGQ